MAIIKDKYPILEFDTEQTSVIMPNRSNKFAFPEKCVFAFLGGTTDAFAAENNCERIGVFDSITKLYPIYKTIYKGEKICFCQAPCGASAAVQIADFLISHGVKYMISCGSCGALHDFEENEIIIPRCALRDEGASYHYMAPSREIALNTQAIESIKRAAESFSINYRECKTWTTDGFFRETREMVKYRKEEGCEVVDMECSALAACAGFRGAVFGQIFFTADTLAFPDKYDERGWGVSSFEKVFELSLEAVYLVDK